MALTNRKLVLRRLLFFVLLLQITLAFARTPKGTPCGWEQMRQPHKTSFSSKSTSFSCSPEDLYDSVYIDTSAHFRIYYTLAGPHKLPFSNADSIQNYIKLISNELEKAYQRQNEENNMLPPLGMNQSYHYQRSDFPEKYPVELIDISLLRNSTELFGGICRYCYGLTIPEDTHNTGRSTLILENDYLFQSINPETAEIPTAGSSCTYPLSSDTLFSSDHTLNYALNPQEALIPTIHHELYHAAQLRYQDFREQYHIWFEASAVAAEIQGAPSSQDYLQYLPSVLENTRIAVDDYSGTRAYGQGAFSWWLQQKFGSAKEEEIWSLLQDYQSEDILYILNQSFIDNDTLNFPLIWHLYAQERIAAQYNNDNYHFPENWNIHPHNAQWPAPRQRSYSEIEQNDLDALNLAPYSYQFYKYSFPGDSIQNAENTALASGWLASCLYLKDQNFYSSNIDSSYIPSCPGLSTANSDSLWLLLSYTASEYSSSLPKHIEYAAWPNPGRGEAVCFHAPQYPQTISFFSSDGYLFANFTATTSNDCWIPQSSNNKALAPGMYYYQFHGRGQIYRWIYLGNSTP
jgi:hypothetical protein